jgi:hypothetical protein
MLAHLISPTLLKLTNKKAVGTVHGLAERYRVKKKGRGRIAAAHGLK